MTLDQLEMLEAIVEEGSYQAAARRIHKSQPALSNGIKKIEELYSITIFSREGYRPALTEVGRQFYETARMTLDSYRQLDKVARELGSGIEPRLDISIDPVVAADKLDRLFEVVHSYDDKTRISIRSGVLFDNAHRVLNNQANLAIGSFPETQAHIIEKSKVFDVTLVPVIHKKLLDQTLSKAFLLRVPNIVVQTEYDTQESVKSSLGRKWSVDSHGRKTELITMGLGWGKLSRSQVAKEPDLVVIEDSIAAHLTIDIYVMRHKEKPLGPVGREIWARMTEARLA